MLAVAITVSDRSAAGERDDASGPVILDALRAAGWTATGVVTQDGVLPVEAAIKAALEIGARLVVTTGGTGIGPRDETPEATTRVLAKELPGVAEALRLASLAQGPDGRFGRPAAALARGLAGIAVGRGGPALVVNLPGSPGGAADGIAFVLEIAEHALAQIDGGDH